MPTRDSDCFPQTHLLDTWVQEENPKCALAFGADDVQTSLQILARAFLHHPLYEWLHQAVVDPALKRESVEFSTLLSHNVCRASGFVLNTRDARTGQVVATAQVHYSCFPRRCWIQTWLAPLVRSLCCGCAARRPWFLASMPTQYFERLQSLEGLSGIRTEHVLPSRSHLYLIQLGCDPSFQGQGFGSATLRAVCGLARRCGLAIYLETDSQRLCDWYASHGFRIKREMVCPDATRPFVQYGMVWEPQGGV